MTSRHAFRIGESTAADDVAQVLPSDRERIASLLAELQAAEGAGASALAQWAASCREPSLAAVLTVVGARDTDHAALAYARRCELGAGAAVEIGRGLADLCAALASRAVSDRSKLAMLMARFPSQPHDLFAAELAVVQADDETRSILEVMGDDERVSLRFLRAIHETPPPDPLPAPLVQEGLLDFLDAFAAAEHGAAVVYSAWAAACPAPGLRGGLRVLAHREETHARLATLRLTQLGGEPRATLAGPTWQAAVAHVSRGEVSDADKLWPLLARYTTDDAAAVRLLDQARLCEGDPTTRTQLELMAATEVATIAWLRRYAGAG